MSEVSTVERPARLVAALVLVVAATGCALVGPTAIRAQRHGYDEALRQTNDQQLLMNIVRLRYGETPSFLDVTGIVVQLRLKMGAEVGAEMGPDIGARTSASLAHGDQPTITYLPLAAPLTPEPATLVLPVGR